MHTRNKRGTLRDDKNRIPVGCMWSAKTSEDSYSHRTITFGSARGSGALAVDYSTSLRVLVNSGTVLLKHSSGGYRTFFSTVGSILALCIHDARVGTVRAWPWSHWNCRPLAQRPAVHSDGHRYARRANTLLLPQIHNSQSLSIIGQ